MYSDLDVEKYNLLDIFMQYLNKKIIIPNAVVILNSVAPHKMRSIFDETQLNLNSILTLESSGFGFGPPGHDSPLAWQNTPYVNEEEQSFEVAFGQYSVAENSSLKKSK